MRIKHKILLLAAAVVVLLAALHVPVLSAAGNFLKLGCETPPQSDAIIVLGGEMNGERTRKGGGELYRDGAAPKVMLSDGTMMSWRTSAIREMYDLAVLEGVSAADLLREEKSRSTYENALYTKELLQEERLNSAVW